MSDPKTNCTFIPTSGLKPPELASKYNRSVPFNASWACPEVVCRVFYALINRKWFFKQLNLISLGLIPRGLPRFLEESLKTDGFHQIKNYLPLNASWACPEDFFTGVIKGRKIYGKTK